jgi:hypothetical protein
MKLIHARDLNSSMNKSSVPWIWIGTYLYIYNYESAIKVLDYYIREAAIKGRYEVTITDGIFAIEDPMSNSTYQRIYNELTSLGYSVSTHYREYSRAYRPYPKVEYGTKIRW